MCFVLPLEMSTLPSSTGKDAGGYGITSEQIDAAIQGTCLLEQALGLWGSTPAICLLADRSRNEFRPNRSYPGKRWQNECMLLDPVVLDGRAPNYQ